MALCCFVCTIYKIGQWPKGNYSRSSSKMAVPFNFYQPAGLVLLHSFYTGSLQPLPDGPWSKLCLSTFQKRFLTLIIIIIIIWPLWNKKTWVFEWKPWNHWLHPLLAVHSQHRRPYQGGPWRASYRYTAMVVPGHVIGYTWSPVARYTHFFELWLSDELINL